MSHDFSASSERRATIMLLKYWEKIRGDRAFPSENDIDPDAISGLWDHCFLVQARDVYNVEDYNFTYLGGAIVKAYQWDMEHNADEPIVSPNATALSTHFQEVLKSGQPQAQEGEFLNLRHARVKYRQILLPLGENGVVDAILGLMSFKIYQ